MKNGEMVERALRRLGSEKKERYFGSHKQDQLTEFLDVVDVIRAESITQKDMIGLWGELEQDLCQLISDRAQGEIFGEFPVFFARLREKFELRGKGIPEKAADSDPWKDLLAKLSEPPEWQVGVPPMVNLTMAIERLVGVLQQELKKTTEKTTAAPKMDNPVKGCERDTGWYQQQAEKAAEDLRHGMRDTILADSPNFTGFNEKNMEPDFVSRYLEKMRKAEQELLADYRDHMAEIVSSVRETQPHGATIGTL